MLAPVPSGPFRSDAQVTFSPRSPSSASVAKPDSVTATPSVTIVPSAGSRIATLGVVLGPGR